MNETAVVLNCCVQGHTDGPAFAGQHYGYGRGRKHARPSARGAYPVRRNQRARGAATRAAAAKPDSIGPMAKMASDVSTKMNTLIDKTSSHIAEMMMQGNMMGVIEITKTIKHNPDADAAALQLARDLLQTQENNIQALKQFL